jgi:hypothetical protein
MNFFMIFKFSAKLNVVSGHDKAQMHQLAKVRVELGASGAWLYFLREDCINLSFHRFPSLLNVQLSRKVNG